MAAVMHHLTNTVSDTDVTPALNHFLRGMGQQRLSIEKGRTATFILCWGMQAIEQLKFRNGRLVHTVPVQGHAAVIKNMIGGIRVLLDVKHRAKGPHLDRSPLLGKAGETR